jgi:hypothetical protein
MSIGMLVLAEIIFFFMSTVGFLSFIRDNQLDLASLNGTSLLMIGIGLFSMGLYLGAWLTERRLKRAAETEQVKNKRL